MNKTKDSKQKQQKTTPTKQTAAKTPAKQTTKQTPQKTPVTGKAKKK